MKNLGFTFLAFVFSFLLSLRAMGGPAVDYKNTSAATAEEVFVPHDEFSLRSDYVFEGEFRDSSLGKQDAFRNAIKYGHRIGLGSGWYLRLGAAYERYDFGGGSAPVPDHLQSAAAVFAVEYKVNGRTGLLIESSPGFYFVNDISGRSFDIPTNFGLAYPVFGGDKFYLAAGASFSLLRSYPVVPFVGVNWQINEKLELRGYLPEPRLVYTPNERFKFWAGGEVAGGAYRTDDNGTHRLRNATLTYSEYRAGAGMTYSMKPWQIELGGGYAFERSFDYHRVDEKYTVNGAPYLALKVLAEF